MDINNRDTCGEFNEFPDRIISDRPIRTTALEGARTVSVSLAAVEPSRTGRPIAPDYDF